MSGRKRARYWKRMIEKESETESESDPFEKLPNDLVIFVLSKLCSSASCPSDFVSALIVCKRFNRLGLDRLVLARAGPNLFAIRTKNWSEFAHRFVKQCVNSGSVEACYFLGMIRFYCLQNRASGASLMAKAAIRSHAPALYSLAIIQFNGSGGSKIDKDLRAGVALCARAAYLGHIDALRELGHCLQDGYGVRQNVPEGRRMLVQANARELALAFPSSAVSSICPCYLSTPHDLHCHHPCLGHQHHKGQIVDDILPASNVALARDNDTNQGCVLGNDFGCMVPEHEPHPTNRFLMEWFVLKGRELCSDLRMCSYSGCGRPETRPHEFRRCSVCGVVNYCSRGCQAHDWKLRHKNHCIPADPWLDGVVDDGVGGGGGFGLGGLVFDQGENDQS